MILAPSPLHIFLISYFYMIQFISIQHLICVQNDIVSKLWPSSIFIEREICNEAKYFTCYRYQIVMISGHPYYVGLIFYAAY